MTVSAEDARYMARALELARRGMTTTDPNPRVGCVIVRDGRVVGEGHHERAGEPHAEVHALAAAGTNAHGATAYVTLEPCCHHGRTPPCSQALIKAGIRRVVAAMRDPNPAVAGKGLEELERHGITTYVGLMEGEAAALNPGFISRMRRGRPHVRIKLAASLDGRTALAGGESKWITGEAARLDVQRWRARSSAILTGVGTVLADNPRMNVREPAAARQPLRVVLDSQWRTPPGCQMLHTPGATLIVGTQNAADRMAALRKAGAELVVLPQAPKVDLPGLMQMLAAREVNEVMVESGATLVGALLRAGLVDELIVYYAPHLLGSDARGMFSLPPLVQMSDRIKLNVVDVRAVGEDWRLRAMVQEA
jgi:diaminohydroxyphosphoribosylaminopyrimidine deaminase / 5-amino-6-(5-phosphoribosylamino)uracil reductase